MSRKSPAAAAIPVRTAPRKSKLGWLPVMGELPPEVFAQLEAYRLPRARTRSDVVFEAVQTFLRQQSRKAA